jgi:hypothetical protein
MCHDATCIRDYKLLTWNKYFKDAGKKTHRSVGERYICVAVCIKGQTTPSHFMVQSYHMPMIPINVLSRGHIMLHHSSCFHVHTLYTNHVTGQGYAKFHGIYSTADVEVPEILWGVLLYSQDSRPAITAYMMCPINTLDVSDDMDGG